MNYWNNNAFKYVKHLQIELTSECNGECIMCPQSTLNRTKQMEDKIFFKIIEEIKNSNIDTIFPYAYGEPLMTKDFINKLKYIKTKLPDIKIIISTNASLLTEETSKKLIPLLYEISFSIDACDKKTFEKIRPGLDYDICMSNINSFLKLNNNKVKTKIYITKQKNNLKDLKKIKKHWENKVDLVSEMWIDNRCITLKNKEKSYFDRANICPCTYTLFGKIIFDSEGNLKFCDQHFHDYSDLGNIKNNTMKELYNSNRFNDLRRLHLTGRKKLISLCEKCSIFYKTGNFDNPEFVYRYGWEK